MALSGPKWRNRSGQAPVSHRPQQRTTNGSASVSESAGDPGIGKTDLERTVVSARQQMAGRLNVYTGELSVDQRAVRGGEHFLVLAYMEEPLEGVLGIVRDTPLGMKC